MVSDIAVPIDRSLLEDGFWRSAVFTVPGDVDEDRVQFSADKYMRKFGNQLEVEGFDVRLMTQPGLDRRKSTTLTLEDRRAYVIWAWVKRRPSEIHVDIPDFAVSAMQDVGLRLTE
jgi:hypothetical protein